MFLLAAFIYPVALAVLTLGAGLALDRISGGFLPPMLLVSCGVASLIAVSQISTYLPGTAPGTPYVMCAVCAAGLWSARGRLRALARRRRGARWQIAVLILAYLLACAPVLAAGRVTFSSYMALADSAVHMLGADFLIRHGQHYGQLDLRNSYGRFLNYYYNTSYPSGSDTLFGASAFLLGLPLIWAFQPFCAFILASAAGPLWLLLRRFGLDRWWALLATLCATLPALVYGYELIGSIKELTALSMILTLGVLVVLHPRWLWGRARGVIPFAVVSAAGISALGVGFGAWVLAALVPLCVLLGRPPSTSIWKGRPLGMIGVGAVTMLVCALPTWVDLSGSLRATQGVASTSNPGNLHKPLRSMQALGIWLTGSYKLPPRGDALTLTYAFIALAALAATLGAWRALRAREYPLLGWLALMLVVWLALSAYSTTWVDAKTLMITSPVLVLLVWAGVAALRSSRWRFAAPALAVLLAGGVFASDAMQYHDSNLAPTARYQELARIDARFAGRGPTLFTDFDEYALYELHDLDVGGPDFVYPPVALEHLARGYGDPVDLDLLAPGALRSYPLIVTRRDPLASRPPIAYSLLWEGTYYQVWGREPHAPHSPGTSPVERAATHPMREHRASGAPCGIAWRTAGRRAAP